MAKVFISYSHKDEKFKDLVVSQLGVLGDRLQTWDDRNIDAGSTWLAEIEKAINEADAAILLISSSFLNSEFIKGKEVPACLQRRQDDGMLVVPVIVRPCAWTKVSWLSPIQARPKDGKALTKIKAVADREEIIAALAVEMLQLLENQPPPDKTEKKNYVSRLVAPPDLARLPSTSSELFGREKELTALDQAWEDDKTFILVLQAWGGAGKTALVNKWLDNMAGDNYRGAQRVYGWSFYSQDSDEGGQGSADPFFAEALKDFGDPDPKEGSPWDKGKRLAKLICQTRTLLVLDGLEPLQYPPGVEQIQGRLKDQGLQALLKQFASFNKGLCLITTRQSVTDLDHAKGGRLKEIQLERLSVAAGAQLLKAKGVDENTPHKELCEAVDEYGGHALTLTLLGTYLKAAHQGEIRKRDKLPGLQQAPKHGSHAVHVMQSYEVWLKGRPELRVLFIMGLFDRPADEGALNALRAEPLIEGLTEDLVIQHEEKWHIAVESLRELGLLSPDEEKKPTKSIDAHPLVREHFGKQLRETNAKAWQQAHERLYEHYKSVPEKEQPDTLEEMAPLFAAVTHGCLAGKHQETLDEVYSARIRRRRESYSTKKLGAFGADLAALAAFFDEPWRRPAAGLNDQELAAVLSWAGFRLRALGRLREAVQPFEAGMKNSEKQEDWIGAAVDAGNLSELLLTLGDVARAVEAAQQSVTFADRSEDAFERESDRTTLADALHQAGRTDEAEKWFREAEDLQKQRQPDYAYLYSLSGYRFCDLLLARGAWREAVERAKEGMRASEEFNFSLLSRASDTLTLGRAGMARAGAEGSPLEEARPWLDRAVAGLRRAGTTHCLPWGLLARAAFFRLERDFDKALEDLTEVQEIAERGEMRLHLTDYHLESARLVLAMHGVHDVFKNHITQAENLIKKTGYHRRDGELEELYRCSLSGGPRL